MTTMLILSSLISIFLWDGNEFAAAESPLTPLTTITGPEGGDNFGWNVSWVGDVNSDGFDDIIAGAPYADRYSGDDWWDNAWSYRKKLIFDNSGQSEDLVNFPVLVNLSSSNFDYSKAKLDGTDLRFIDEDGVTELNYDIESWNSSGNSFIWVNVTRIDAGSSTDYIWMYYGNPVALDGQNKGGTYDSSYVGVWHLNEIGNGIADEFEDSTSYNNDGQGGSGNSSYIPTRIEGKIGGGQDFDGIDDHINSGYSTSLDIGGTQITLEAWINFPGNDPLNYLGIISHSGWDQGYRLVIENSADPLCFHLPEDTFTLVSAQDTPIDSWVHVVGVYDGSNMMIYINGVKDTNELSKTDNIVTTPNEFWIGHGDNAVGETWSYPWNGSIDEVRISNIARSTDWIKAQHLSMNDTYITYGDEETRNWWNTDWSYRKKLTFDNSGQSEDLVNFPVLVNLSASNFDYSKAKIDGTDLRFIDENGITELKYHIEDWNFSGYSYVWVNVTTIDAGISTDYIWMYYGNSGASNAQDVSGTYDANYVGVWHLSEDPTGVVYDSTSNDNDGTSYGSMTSIDQVVGKIDSSLDFDGVDDYISLTNMISGTTGTYSFWLYTRNVTGEHNIIADNAYQRRIYLRDDRVRIETDTDGEYFDFTASSIPINTWTHVVIARAGDIGDLYINGSWLQQVEVVGADFFNISCIGGTDNLVRMFDGVIDEVRISNVARSADWLKAQYLSMNDTFITYRDEETRDWWNPGWLFRKKLTFDNRGQSEDLVNFPILVNLSASNFDYLKAKLDGTDLRFIDEDGVTELKHHIEDWNTSGSSYVWVNVTNIEGGSSTDFIWMYYGNSGASDVQDVSGTYDASYVGVWHLMKRVVMLKTQPRTGHPDPFPEASSGE